MSKKKMADFKVRVTAATKARVAAIAQARGESESVILREAITRYLETQPESTSPHGRLIKPGPTS